MDIEMVINVLLRLTPEQLTSFIPQSEASALSGLRRQYNLT
jgi:hypothetical protein